MKYSTLFTILCVTLLAGAITLFLLPTQEEREGITITATFYPLAFAAQEIAGEHARVISITPPGAEAHHYEPTPQDVTNIMQSNLFLVNGGGLDPWAERLLPDLQRRGIPVAIMINRFPNLEDPHFWLDPLLMKEYVQVVEEQLTFMDPANEQAYHNNAMRAFSALDLLHKEYGVQLSTCNMRDAIVMHDAFGYLQDRYRLVFHSVAGLSPEAEPSPQKIAALADLAKNHGISVVFFEEQASPRIAETIAREANITTRLLHPLENLSPQEQQRGETYFSLMRQNLQELREALQCE
ncbi:MAG: metal ABC transporter substrate-binding protein [bacterium]|nr:metal ABC transporter substrate-binding protein [bacterium]